MKLVAEPKPAPKPAPKFKMALALPGFHRNDLKFTTNDAGQLVINARRQLEFQSSQCGGANSTEYGVVHKVQLPKGVKQRDLAIDFKDGTLKIKSKKPKTSGDAENGVGSASDTKGSSSKSG